MSVRSRISAILSSGIRPKLRFPQPRNLRSELAGAADTVWRNAPVKDKPLDRPLSTAYYGQTALVSQVREAFFWNKIAGGAVFGEIFGRGVIRLDRGGAGGRHGQS